MIFLINNNIIINLIKVFVFLTVRDLGEVGMVHNNLN